MNSGAGAPGTTDIYGLLSDQLRRQALAGVKRLERPLQGQHGAVAALHRLALEPQRGALGDARQHGEALDAQAVRLAAATAFFRGHCSPAPRAWFFRPRKKWTNRQTN